MNKVKQTNQNGKIKRILILLKVPGDIWILFITRIVVRVLVCLYNSMGFGKLLNCMIYLFYGIYNMPFRAS